MRPKFLAVLVAAVLVGCATTSQRQLRKDGDYSWVRGANYVPSYASTDVGIWRDFDADVIDRELGYAEALGMNSVRTFLQYHVYEQQRETFLADVATFVDLCEKHNIRPMLTVFDSCMAVSPSMASEHFWVASPGWDRANAAFYPQGEAYVRDLVELFRNDDRILMWDVMNEPTVTPQGLTPQGKQEIWDFVRHFASYFRELGATQPLTAGVVGHGNEEILGYVDVLSLHAYSNTEQGMRDAVNAVQRMAAEVGKPCIVTETGSPGAGSPYEMCIRVCDEKGIGFYVWELMVGKTMFRYIQGIVYPDGTVRQRAVADALLKRPATEFVEKPESEGVPLGYGLGWRELFVCMLERMVQTPTDSENWRERYTVLFDASTTLQYLGDKANEVATGAMAAKEMHDFGMYSTAYVRFDQLLKLALEDIRGE